ncbi:hypothetical protein [Piscinibacter sakaiensis]|uniref:hypothetical protein n=1 Tax=Piscinibacter sakaiensis TaxID=1547922 RepID=UPI003AAC0F90
MLDAATLQKKARAEAQQQFDALMKGTVRLQPVDRETAWDGLLKRHVHVERMAAWHQFNEIRIEVDAQGQVRFFHDPKRFEGATFHKLSEAEVLRICATTGLVGKRIESVDQSRTSDDMLAVLVKQRHHRLPPTIQFLINCSTAKIAALRVLQGAT